MSEKQQIYLQTKSNIWIVINIVIIVVSFIFKYILNLVNLKAFYFDNVL